MNMLSPTGREETLAILLIDSPAGLISSGLGGGQTFLPTEVFIRPVGKTDSHIKASTLFLVTCSAQPSSITLISVIGIVKRVVLQYSQ